ncbi:MAG: dockerin type I repeat-containing protein [Ruminococcus sp.]|nr:dockerin type I repeat-containing protein [Ruminococcus sp.]
MNSYRRILSLALALVLVLSSLVCFGVSADRFDREDREPQVEINFPHKGDRFENDEDKIPATKDERPCPDKENFRPEEPELPEIPTRDEFPFGDKEDMKPDMPTRDEFPWDDDDDKWDDDKHDDKEDGHRHHGYKPCATPDFAPVATPDFVIVDGKPEGERPADIYEIFGDFVFIGKDCDKVFLLIYLPEEDRFCSLREAFDEGMDKMDEVFEELKDRGNMHLIGDANEDKELNIKDATAIQKCIAGIDKFADSDAITGEAEGDETLQFISDFNRDGERNVKDATAIQKYLAGLPY